MAKRKIKKEETPEQDLGIGGLGDLIAKVTDTLNITKCQKCEERQSRLNRLFPWLKASRDVTQEERDLMARINAKPSIENDDVNALFKLYNELFSSKLSRCACPGLIGKMIQRINVFIQP
jgi:hypothetical protein